MILNYAIFKRDAYLGARVPQVIKNELGKLAKSKGKNRSEYLLELVLKELEREGIQIMAQADNSKKQ